MRLSYEEAKVIVDNFKDIFHDGKIYLFGSRIDDSAKGGDIDLYIIPKSRNSLTEKKIEFLRRVKSKIGDQKIDVVFEYEGDRAIEYEALSKGVELDLRRLQIENYLKQCRKHKLLIEKAYSKVKDIFPISPSRYEKLTDDEIEAIDQYLFRFAKLQDTIGAKLFKLIVSEYEDSIERMRFIDILNRLEKIGILEDSNIWMRFREIRNDISHQYDDIPEESADILNRIFASKDELLSIYENIEKFYSSV